MSSGPGGGGGGGEGGGGGSGQQQHNTSSSSHNNSSNNCGTAAATQLSSSSNSRSITPATSTSSTGTGTGTTSTLQRRILRGHAAQTTSGERVLLINYVPQTGASATASTQSTSQLPTRKILQARASAAAAAAAASSSSSGGGGAGASSSSPPSTPAVSFAGLGSEVRHPRHYIGNNIIYQGLIYRAPINLRCGKYLWNICCT